MQRIARLNFDKIAFILLIAFTLFLAFYNLEGYPNFNSHDEGYRLQLPKNLVLHGQWAAVTNDGFVSFGADSTGPAVMLPITLSFQLLGISLWNARLIMALYLVLSVVTLYFCVRYLYSAKIALLACLLYMFIGPEWLNTIWIGRQVYGEVPSLAFLFLGAHLWFVALEKENRRLLLVSGFCFGLAAIAKEFILFGFFGAFSLVFLVDLMRQRRPRLGPFIIPMVISLSMLIIWLVFRNWVDIPNPTRVGLIEQLRTRLFPFAPHLWFDSFKYLGQEGYLLWGLPALLYTVMEAFRSDNPKILIRELFFPCFVIVWMSWYAVASIGWERYAYPGWAITAILLAKFLHDLIVRFQVVDKETDSGRSLRSGIAYVPALLLVVLLIFWPVQNVVRRIVTEDNQAAFDMANHIAANVPANASIASAEWEIDFLTDHAYAHIPVQYIDAHINHFQLGQPLDEEDIFDIRVYDLNYVVSGPYSRGTQFIPDDYLADQKLIASFGDYDLYQVTSE